MSYSENYPLLRRVHGFIYQLVHGIKICELPIGCVFNAQFYCYFCVAIELGINRSVKLSDAEEAATAPAIGGVEGFALLGPLSLRLKRILVLSISGSNIPAH